MIVFDFDGTMTDAEREGAPFRTAYLDDLAAICSAPRAEIEEQARKLEEEVMAAPGRHGWVYQGRIVAPATVDPYLRIMPVARAILTRHGRLLDETDRTRILDGILYKHNYAKTAIVFREGARELLEGLRHAHVHIVSNTHTAQIRRKIRLLGGGSEAEEGAPGALEWLLPRVEGGAMKYVIDDAHAALPESLAVPGLERPVLLRRARYHSVLDRLRQAAGARWEDVLVVGDIFELDLALPLVLGARVALCAGEHTPAYEVAYVQSHPRGRVVRSLHEVRALLGARSA